MPVVRLDGCGSNRVVPTVFEDGPMNLARTQRGLMIHRRDCRYAHNGIPWLWADDKDAYDVWQFVRVFGYRTCRQCDPLDTHR